MISFKEFETFQNYYKAKLKKYQQVESVSNIPELAITDFGRYAEKIIGVVIGHMALNGFL